MNGMISNIAIKGIVERALAEHAERTGDVSTGAAVQNLLVRLGEIVERASNADLNVVAYDVVDRDMIGSSVGTLHKIRAIKDVRTITLCGLREAKEAVEHAIGEVLRDRANAALSALKEYNTGKPSEGQYVNALAHRDVLIHIQEAADQIPF